MLHLCFRSSSCASRFSSHFQLIMPFHISVKCARRCVMSSAWVNGQRKLDFGGAAKSKPSFLFFSFFSSSTPLSCTHPLLLSLWFPWNIFSSFFTVLCGHHFLYLSPSLYSFLSPLLYPYHFSWLFPVQLHRVSWLWSKNTGPLY